MASIIRKIVVGVVLLTTIVTLAQKSDGQKARVNGRNFYMGYDQAKELAAKSTDTTFVRYFAGNFKVDSTEVWTNKIVYKGHKVSDHEYVFSSFNYVKHEGSDDLKLRKEWRNTYAIKSLKNSKNESKAYLLDGLVEEVVYQGKGKQVRCIDKEGKIINEIGCLRYTSGAFPEDELLKLRIRIVDATRKVIGRNSGALPKYTLRNVVADYESKTWKVYQEFPIDFDKNSKMYKKLYKAAEDAVMMEKLEDIFYDKDINGNYYNNIFFINERYD